MLKLALIICLVMAFSANGQVWKTVGTGIDNFSTNQWQGVQLLSTEDTSGVYVAITYPYTTGEIVKIAKWNGLNWVYSPPLAASQIFDIAVADGNVYVKGVFGSPTDPIHKFDGTSWSTHLPSGFTGAIMNLTVCNGLLYCCGAFTANGGITNIMTFDGVSFSAVPDATSLWLVRDVALFNNELYAIGRPTLPGYPADSTILKLSTSNTWVPAFQHSQNDTLNNMSAFFVEYQNDLHVISSQNKLYRLKNDSLQYLGSSFITGIDGATVLDSSLYLWEFGNYTLNDINKFTNGTFSLVNTPNRLVGLSVFKNELYTFSKTQEFYNGIAYNGAFRTDGIDSLAVLSGTLFYDTNANCTKDTLERGISQIIISFDNGAYRISTNYLGQYSIGLPAGVHTIDSVYVASLNGKNIGFQCGLPQQITLSANQYATQNIALRSTVAADAIVKAASSTGFRALYGFASNYQIDVVNGGNTVLSNAVLNVEFPSTFLLQPSTTPPSSQNGNLLTFNLPAIQPFSKYSVYVKTLVDTAQNSINDQVVLSTWLNAIPLEADNADNFDTIVQLVRAAFDPNDKQASAEVIAPYATEIDYHIRFQNTGNDTAYKVVVVDTIHSSLPLTGFVMNMSSHPYKFSMNGDIMIWEFDNILLPDSSVDYDGSQGFINFTAYIDPSSSVGDTLRNSASIYFDFQKPVLTNTAKTVVVLNFSVAEFTKAVPSIRIFPNPTKDILLIQNESKLAQRITITDINGRLVAEKTLEKTEEWMYDVQQLAAGMYIISTGTESYKVVVLD